MTPRQFSRRSRLCSHGCSTRAHPAGLKCGRVRHGVRARGGGCRTRAWRGMGAAALRCRLSAGSPRRSGPAPGMITRVRGAARGAETRVAPRLGAHPRISPHGPGARAVLAPAAAALLARLGCCCGGGDGGGRALGGLDDAGPRQQGQDVALDRGGAHLMRVGVRVSARVKVRVGSESESGSGSGSELGSGLEPEAACCHRSERGSPNPNPSLALALALTLTRSEFT